MRKGDRLVIALTPTCPFLIEESQSEESKRACEYPFRGYI